MREMSNMLLQVKIWSQDLIEENRKMKHQMNKLEYDLVDSE